MHALVVVDTIFNEILKVIIYLKNKETQQTTI